MAKTTLPRRNLYRAEVEGKPPHDLKRTLQIVELPTARNLAGRKGRPLNSEKHLTLEALKPWAAEGMSRSTWYRRLKKS